jgi:hypothetical protein
LGQTYQNRSITSTDDVTGTLISSDKPIAVFAGADVAFVPDASTHAANPLVQEQIPVDEWGTNALALSFAGRTGGDSYRVLAAYSNTVVAVTTTNGTFTTNITAGGFCDTNLDGPVEFLATKPIQVAHFANGKDFDNALYGDPCEILLPPTDHYLETNIVFRLPNDNASGDFVENYLSLVVPQSAITNTMVDTNHISATNFVAIGTSGFYGARITLTNNGVHKVTSSQPVGVEAYGWGSFDAYGYFGGIVK